jgi:hypothetical protein
MNLQDKRKPVNIFNFINRVRKDAKSRIPFHTNKFFNGFFTAFEVYLYVEEHKYSTNRHKTHARKMTLVASISLFETFLKDCIIFYRHAWTDTGLRELLSKEKYTLAEAYDVFKKKQVTKEHLVAHFHSFPNIESIDYVFSTLIQRKFFHDFAKFTTSDPMYNLSDNAVSKRLQDAYELRNRIVHECYAGPFSLAALKRHSGYLFQVAGMLMYYFDSLSPQRKRKFTTEAKSK